MEKRIIYRLMYRYVGTGSVLFEPVTAWFTTGRIGGNGPNGREVVEWGYTSEEQAVAALWEHQADERYIVASQPRSDRIEKRFMLFEDRALETGTEWGRYRLAERIGKCRYGMVEFDDVGGGKREYHSSDMADAIERRSKLNRAYYQSKSLSQPMSNPKPKGSGTFVIIKEPGTQILHATTFTRIER